MKAFTCVALVAMALPFAGCSNESGKGGPGANAAKEGENNTFTLKVPSAATSVAQGGRDDVTVSIDRGSEFKQAVNLRFKTPTGLKVVPGDASIKSDASETKVTVEAAADAPPGDMHIEVTAVPETGKSVSQQLPIRVTKP